jgi:hypothetical protein
MYLATRTRPNILFNVSLCARFISNPSEQHWDMLDRIRKYIVGFTKKEIIY